eukprot:365408-Chlamydomonas_euryale.AAC.1
MYPDTVSSCGGLKACVGMPWRSQGISFGASCTYQGVSLGIYRGTYLGMYSLHQGFRLGSAGACPRHTFRPPHAEIVSGYIV